MRRPTVKKFTAYLPEQIDGKLSWVKKTPEEIKNGTPLPTCVMWAKSKQKLNWVYPITDLIQISGAFSKYCFDLNGNNEKITGFNHIWHFLFNQPDTSMVLCAEANLIKTPGDKCLYPRYINFSTRYPEIVISTLVEKNTSNLWAMLRNLPEDLPKKQPQSTAPLADKVCLAN